MLIIISGQPGNGKSLRAMALMHEEHERNAEAVKQGKEQPRRFFTNIAGATVDENPQAFEWVEKLPDHNDWTKLPDGSFVIYDEAHSDGNTVGLERYGRLFPATGKPGESDDPRIRAMSTHRHRGFDIVLVTQWPSKIHHNVRQLAGKHIHMNRAMGLARAGSLTWSRVQADPYDEQQREKAEEEIWSFPPALYGRYKSATLHTATYKFRIPKKALGALASLLMMVAVGWGLWFFVFKPAKADESTGEHKEQAAEALAPLGAGAPPPEEEKPRWKKDPNEPGYGADYARDHLPRFPSMPWTAPIFDERQVVADPILVCAEAGAGEDVNGNWRDASCTCLTEQGTTYDMPDGECRAIARKGPRYNPYKVRTDVAMAGGVGGMPPTAMTAPAVAVAPSAAVLTSSQVTGYGDIGARRIESAPVDRW